MTVPPAAAVVLRDRSNADLGTPLRVPDAGAWCALKTLSPLARAFLKAYRNALGSDLPRSGTPTGGDNRTAALTTGFGA